MNTIDGLRMSLAAVKLVKAQTEAAEFERLQQEFIEYRKISTIVDVVARFRSMAKSFHAVGENFDEMADEIEQERT